MAEPGAAATVVRDDGSRRLPPPFTGEHQDLRESVRRWVHNEVLPDQAEWERAREFPRELFERAGELGFLGLRYPTELGGQGGDFTHDAIWTEEIAAAGMSGGVGASLGAHTGIATPPVFKFGTPDQHQRLLMPAIRGEKIAALGITEPGGGSDVAGIRTKAERCDGGFIVNGSKTFITNGVRADFVVCAVKTTPDGGHRGLSFLIIERGMEGFEVSRKLEKMGWHASDTAELSFSDVFVPEENLLGDENQGFYLIMANFQWERLMLSLGALGGMRWCLERTLAYTQEREVFGRPISSLQSTRHKIAEMATKLEVGQALCYNALRLMASDQDATREVTQAKLFTQRAAVEVADEAVQLHGGYGYMREYEVERALRDARLGPIGGGTDEIMKEILGRGLGL